MLVYSITHVNNALIGLWYFLSLIISGFTTFVYMIYEDSK